MKRFKDNNDGTITDTETNLIWMKNADYFGKPVTWEEANNLPEGWRLPTDEELFGLVNNKAGKNIKWLISHGFENVKDYYWSGTEYAPDAGYAWLVYMFDGHVYYFNKTYNCYVWAVRKYGLKFFKKFKKSYKNT